MVNETDMKIGNDLISPIVNKGKETVANYVCNLDSISMNELFHDYSMYLFIPIAIIIILMLIYKWSPVLIDRYHQTRAKFGAFWIYMIMDNKQIKKKFKRLDTYNNFEFKDGMYSAEKMTDYIIGYDKNIPILLYHKSFITPLTVDYENSSLILKTNPKILKTTYRKKLISDLYSVSRDTAFNQKIVMIVIIIIGLIVLYYTGLLAQILGFLGIENAKEFVPK